MTQNHCNLLIIGAGIAGLSAAKTALDQNKSVILLSKGPLKQSSSQYAQGGIAVALPKTDTPTKHLEDTLIAGAGLCNPESVKTLVEDGPLRVNELIQWGANFDKENGHYHFTKEGAHSQRRILHAGDQTGKEIQRTLGQAIAKNPYLRLLENTMATTLIIENEECMGAHVIQNGIPDVITADATLIATGSCCQVYAHTTTPGIATGDGIAMAHQVGLPVKDMEFIQFHPTTLVSSHHHPVSIFLISEAVRGEGAILRNIHGERFMPEYHPLAELAPRDIVARAIYTETQKTKHPVFLDLSPIEDDIKTRFPSIYDHCLQAGINITHDFIPVSPAAHYCMGGIETSINGETQIKRLYAAGESANLGIHGANRLASNSLLDGLVFGHRAAKHAGTQPKLENNTPTKVKTRSLLSKAEISQLKTLKQQIKSTMWRNASIIRNKTELLAAQKNIEIIQKKLEVPVYHEHYIETQNMATVSALIISAALAREKSIGAHFRSDETES